MSQGDCEDSVLVHTVDFVSAVGASSAGAFAFVSSFQLSPGNTTLHPWLSAIAAQFQRYKLKFLRLHYQHFVGTTAAGQLVIQFTPDPLLNNGSFATVTQAQSLNMSNFMSGALYEDFYHTADLHGLDAGDWYNTEVSLGTGGAEDNYSGMIGIASANTGGATPNTGNFWIEAVYEFNSRKMSTITIGLTEAKTILTSRLDRRQKQEYLAIIFARLCDEQEEAERKRKVAQADPVTALVERLTLSSRPSLRTA